MKAKSISRPKPYLLSITWLDGLESTISLEQLRRSCPCAVCTGESVGDKIYSLPRPIQIEAGVFDIESMKAVGNYAIAVAWQNGHNTGIYTWEKLREICQKYTLNEQDLASLEEKHAKNKKKIQLQVIK